MKNWQKLLVAPQSTILETLRVIDGGSRQIALVVDADNRFIATVTDGDIRRGILKGLPLESPISLVMNTEATVAPAFETTSRIRSLMQEKQLRQIPIVDESGFVLGLECLEDLATPESNENWVILMAGGRGVRLRPLTDVTPKPLLKIGDKPVLETIISQLLEQGFSKFYMAINYKAEMIRHHFGNGSKLGIDITYLEENSRLGTAGALTLLNERPSAPFIVMNGDLITKLDFRHLLRFHAEEGAAATMCVRKYDFQVPYGVVQLKDSQAVSLEEKPIQQFFVNAGIYVLSPQVLDDIPADTAIDMPQVLSNLIEKQQHVAAFPITEYWIDIGKFDDYERAKSDALEHAVVQHAFDANSSPL